MAERIFKNVGGTLTLIASRDPAKRYKYTTHPVDKDSIYLEFTAAEETARTTEEAIPPPPFSGLGRCIATRAGQSIPNSTATAVLFTTEVTDVGDYHDPVTNADRFTVGAAQGGVFDVKAHLRYNESTAAGGGTANSGDRGLQIRLGANPVVTQRQRASSSGDTELIATTELELVAGDIVRVGSLHNNGGTVTVDARFSIRRISALES